MLQVSRIEFGMPKYNDRGVPVGLIEPQEHPDINEGHTICECCGSMFLGENPKIYSMNDRNHGIMLGINVNKETLAKPYSVGESFWYEHIDIEGDTVTLKLRGVPDA